MKNPEGISYIKVILLWTLILITCVGGFVVWNEYLSGTEQKITYGNEADEAEEFEDTEFEGIEATGLTEQPFTGENEKNALLNQNISNGPSNTSENFNILVLGIDRRTGDEKHWRTDVIQLITLSPDRSNAVITHIPRDVWAGSYKINGVYNLQGPDAMKDEIERVTGQRPDRIIRVDFDAFVWAIDGVGGLTIDVPLAFTDPKYPNDRNGTEELMSAVFEEGPQTMDGETALIYVRSRKGNNGQGSDYARGRRQQQVMEAIIDDYFNPSNLFQPKTAETLYKIATQKIYTDISLKDTQVLYELLKDYDNIAIHNIGLDTTNYLTVPSNRADYGGAWTLIAKNNDYTPIHNEINAYISGEVESAEVLGITTTAPKFESTKVEVESEGITQ